MIIIDQTSGFYIYTPEPPHIQVTRMSFYSLFKPGLLCSVTGWTADPSALNDSAKI